ncbi:MAG: response regulator [Syntrophobacteraceae bacterium]
MDSLTLIIVDDETAHFELMKRATLKEYPGASIHHFTDGGSCLQGIRAINPDVIIADYRLPGMSGIELLQSLNDRHESIPVILVTGQGDESIAAQAIKQGAQDYLVKSADSFLLIPGILAKAVSERRLRECLETTERCFQDLAVSTLTWIWEIDPQGRYTYSNSVVEAILGYRPEEVLGRHCSDFFPDEHRADLWLTMSRIMEARGPLSGLVRPLVHKLGQGVIMESNGIPLIDRAGSLLGYRGMDRDITQRRQAEEHIHLLTRQLMRAQEYERQKLSRDLHDTIAQDLSSLKIGIETLLDDVPESDPRARDKIARLTDMLQRTIAAVRDLSYDLRPVTLDQLGLVQTIQQLSEEFSQRNGIEVDFLSAGMDDLELGYEMRITLFRLIQEGLNNVRKHAQAHRVSLRLVASYPKIILQIEDDGMGFHVQERMTSAIRERRMGLRSMEERVALLGGAMKLDSRPMQGTRIRIEVPFRESKDGDEKDRSDR